jgi:hypothetical protein
MSESGVGGGPGAGAGSAAPVWAGRAGRCAPAGAHRSGRARRAKVASLVAGMLAGADSIDDMALLPHPAMGKVFNRP